MHELSEQPFFPPVMPADLASKDRADDSDQEDEGPVRTQMVGEAPGEDLGYDPSKIPTEKIPDEDDEDDEG